MGTKAQTSARRAFDSDLAGSPPEEPSHGPGRQWPEAVPAGTEGHKDYLTRRDGIACAGAHLIIDLWDAHYLDDLKRIESALRACVAAAGATLLHIHLHQFSVNGGISGVAVLAESHVSVHTWPERGYAAFDAFMCGDTKPETCVPVLEAAFEPARVDVQTHLRGRIE